MSNLPNELRYASSHEWSRIESDGTITVEITEHAQDQLGDVVFVELPEVGTDLAVGDEVCVVESVKAASDIYAPVSGKVLAVNGSLEDEPELVNTEPYGAGWFFKIKPADDSDLDNLLSAEDYLKSIDE